MSLTTALYTGVSGLSAMGTALSVIGDNISNSNTIGYKGSNAQFGDVLSQALGGSSSQIGRGTYLQGVAANFNQGTLQTTSNPLDLAIQGDGFFIVKNPEGAINYTRAGQFTLDKDGNIANPEGLLLQGYLSQKGGQSGNINVSSVNSPPLMTGTATISTNLDASKLARDPSSAFKIDSSNNTIKFSIGVTDYTATIASGSYAGTDTATQSGLDDAVELALNAATSALGPNQFTVTFDSVNNRFNIKNSTGSSVKFNWDAAGTTAENVLGFASKVDTVPGALSLPITFDATNNALRVQVGAGAAATITITPGAYAAGPALATEIQTQLNTVPGGPIFVVAYAAATGLTITNNSGSNAKFIWDDALIATTSAKDILGFGGAPAGTQTIQNGGSISSFVNTSDSQVYGNSVIFIVSNANNTIVFNDGSDRTATVTPGSYTADGLTAAIKSALEAADNPVSANTYSIGYDPETNLFSFDVDAGSTADITINWDNSNTTMDSLLGFNAFDASPVSINSAAEGSTVFSDFAAVGFDPDDASITSDFSTSLTFYDSLGNSHIITTYFRKTGDSTTLADGTTGSQWHWYSVIPSTDSSTGQVQVGAQGYLQFNNLGSLVADTQEYGTGTTGFNFAGSVKPDQKIAIDFGKSTTEGGNGLDGTTQYGSPNSVLYQSQDGYGAGSLSSLLIDQDGVITGVFTNGQKQEIAKLSLAKFISPMGLTKIGRNLFGETSSSGQPIIGSPGTSGRGMILSSSLEMSNVDLADEFVKMITAQRGFQANTKIISTTDQMMQDMLAVMR